ncbi:MAG: hypothetical protein ABI700_00570 [Chloroflexota bacterium]
MMRGDLIGCLLIPSVTEVTEIAKGMGLVPACAVVIDRVLILGFMAGFTGRRLRTALCLNGCDPKENRKQKNESAKK